MGTLWRKSKKVSILIGKRDLPLPGTLPLPSSGRKQEEATEKMNLIKEKIKVNATS